MSPITLDQILDLVGKLDDSPGHDTPRERFRHFLTTNVQNVGQLRDYIQTCLNKKGDQYSKALQDLINHLGVFLGFTVKYGRYQGVANQIGFDGHWISAKGFHIVIEVKTTEVYAVKPSTLVGYVDALISARDIPSWDEAMGLYVLGKPNEELRQIRNAIVGERRTGQLRLVSVDSLLSLAELVSTYDVGHKDVLSILRPSGPSVDPIANLLARLVAEPKAEETLIAVQEPELQRRIASSKESYEPSSASYWLTPVSATDEQSAEAIIQNLVGKHKVYAFGERTPGRKHIAPGDSIAFYASGNGVVAHAEIASRPENRVHKAIHDPDKYNWVFQLRKPILYLDQPVVIDAECRSHLAAFEGREQNRSWAWFVQATRKLSRHDYNMLTRANG